MSKTIRHLPENHLGIKHPKMFNSKKQSAGLKADEIVNNYEISHSNRWNRHVAIDFNSLMAAASHEVYTA